MTASSNQRVADRLKVARGLSGRVDAVAERVGSLRSRMAALPPTFDAKLLFDIEGLCGTLREDLARISGKLNGGNAFLTGFGLWMSGNNVARLEQLMDKAEKGAA